MPQIIECVPNFSEGRNPAVVQALTEAVTSTPGVWLLDHAMDEDHHRSVLTFAGLPEAVGEAAYRTIKVATELIDLRRHSGVHPCVGATDVVPFIPIQDVEMAACVQLARAIGQKVGADLGLPVFLYEEAATHRDHAQLENIRCGGAQGLAARMLSDPTWMPDFGPAQPHETAGMVVIGARKPLIAFNVNLNTSDLTAAKEVAKTLRQSNGGLPCLKAIGVKLASRGLVQVAMNLTDYRVTSMHTAFQAVRAEAAKRGIEIVGTEIVGLVPQAALDQVAAASIRLERFNSTQVLETRVGAAMSRERRSDQSLAEFLTAVSETKPTPGGGSVAALVGALAASLGVMGARLDHQHETQQQLVRLSQRLLQLVQEDSAAYLGLSEAYKLPKQHPDRPRLVSPALYRSTQIPLEIAEQACEAGLMIHAARKSAAPAVHPDLTVGMITAIAAVEAGLHIVAVNMKRQTNHELKSLLLPRITKATASLEELKGLCYTPPPNS